jgi:hypothetical protein
MSDLPLRHTDPQETPELTFRPDPDLAGQLLAGALGALAAGGLAVAATLAESSPNPAPGFTLAHGLAWAALVPLCWVLRAYLALARATESTGLRKSSLCLFGTVVLLNVAELATLDGLGLGWHIAAWAILGIGFLALVTAPFVPAGSAETPPGAEDTPEAKESVGAEESGSAASKTGLVGGLAVALVVVFKLTAKSFFVKLLLVRNLGRLLSKLDAEMAGAVALAVLVLLGAAFVIWFAASKIRLRDRLGGMAALVGGRRSWA